MSTQTNGHNGWLNYSTWNIPLHINNTEWCYRLKEQERKRGPFTASSAKRLAISIFGEATPDGVKLNRKCINWKEIANAWNEDQ